MMVTRLDCNDDNIIEDVSINEANMLHFLGIIEEHANEILNGFYLMNINGNIGSSDSVDASDTLTPDNTQLQRVLGVGPKLPMAVDTMNVNPPKLLDYSSDENSVEDGNDTGSRPLTLDEVKSKMMTRISQKRSKAPKTDGQTIGGRRGSISHRRRTTLLAADAAVSMMSRRRTTVSFNNGVK